VDGGIANHLRIAGGGVARRGGERPAEAGKKDFLQTARAERLPVCGVERAEPPKHLMAATDARVEAHAELIDLPDLHADGRQVLGGGVGSRRGDALEHRQRDRIETIRRDPVAGKRSAASGRGIEGERIASMWETVNRPRSVDDPFTFIELRLNARGEGEGKLNLATRIEINRNGRMVELENFDNQPIALNEVRPAR
jgi:hypothetical protein